MANIQGETVVPPGQDNWCGMPYVLIHIGLSYRCIATSTVASAAEENKAC